MKIHGVLFLLACATLSCSSQPQATAREAPTAERAPAAVPAPAAAPAPEARREVPPELFAAVEAAPEDPRARRALAIALHEAGRREEALEHFEQLVRRAPDARHLLDLALAYGAARRPTDAEATYRRLLELEPRNAVALHNLGNLALARGDAAAARELYGKALAAKPDYLLARGHLADALRQLGQFEDAYRSYEQVLEMEPQNAAELEVYDDALYQMALLDLQMGATERAAQELAALVESVPDHPHAHYAYGRALTALGRIEEAQREMEAHRRLLAAREPVSAVAAGDEP